MSHYSDAEDEEDEGGEEDDVAAEEEERIEEIVAPEEVEWETIVASEIEEMPPTKASPAPCTPGKTTPAKKPSKPSSSGVASIEKGIGTMSVSASPQRDAFALYNMNMRFPCTAPFTTFLKGGEKQCFLDYLVPSSTAKNFLVEVSEDGMSVKVRTKIPKAFIDLNARALAEFDTRYEDSRVIVSAFRSTVDSIVRNYGPDFDNIWSPGQVDPLPFPCQGNPFGQIIWHEGDEAIQLNLNNLGVEERASHQMMCLLRVLLKSKETMRKSAVRVDDMILRRPRGSAFESADCAPPPPPSSPFASPAGNQMRSNWGGGGGGGGGGGRFPPLAKLHTSNSYHSSINGSFEAATVGDQTSKVRTTSPSKNNNNANTRKRKSPRADEAGGDGDAKMSGSINLVEDYYNGLADINYDYEATNGNGMGGN